MYKNGQSSPLDRDENGRSHAATLVEEMQWYMQCFWACEEAADRFLQLLGTLIDFVQGDNDTITVSGIIYGFFSKIPKENWTAKQKMLSMLTETFEIDQETIPYCMEVGSDITSSFRKFSNLAKILGIELPPIARAIISRSLPELEKIVLCDPTAPIKDILGLTTLQLCASWPQGLQFLLGTEAKRLIDFGRIASKGERDEEFLFNNSPARAPIELAIIFGSAGSVDVLMKAGCIWHDRMLYKVNEEDYLALDKVMNSLASNIAARRWLLFEVAERELGSSRYMGPSCVPDSMAARLCKELDDYGIPIAPFLRVSPSYATIYHYPNLQLYHFPIFFENGIRGCASHNDIGLTPVMIWRQIVWLHPDLLRTFPFWLHKQGLLDQKPKDPAKLGLNLHATGWHYIASMLSPTFRRLNLPRQLEMEWKVMNSVSTAGVRDNCVCWCCVDDKGCSPLISLWKVAADMGGAIGRFRRRQSQAKFTRHIFFHDNNMFGLNKDKMSATTLLLEFLRFLTFEALDMQHTCCTLKEVDLTNRKCLPIPYNTPMVYYLRSAVLVNADPEVVRQIRSNDSEKRLLESLMDEFTKELERMESSPKMLERFLWGYWRRRMSEIYAIDLDIVDEMGQVVENIQTHELPERILNFLGYDFHLIRFYVQKKVAVETSDDEIEDDASSIEDIDVLPPCGFCDGQWFDSDDSDGNGDSDDDEDSDSS